MVDLTGTWRVAEVSGADAGTDPERAPWLTFDGDGQVYGFAGVNRVRGTWAREGDTVTFGPLVSTLMAGPEPAMELESALTRLLDGPLTVAEADGSLVLRAPDGRAATLTDDPPAAALA
ncbi:META domain-containing protein [Cellulomonas alba]|uniref:META domain-containing protein n=1 Tax=Cellulomonas alba TaxID=3053467 RepID=A0ABT7SD17_9CELL|nr:META domain-containing protein [Cellulomonas alba]MDM7854070.1 META domain-containing protein [Cellulomonas alba]